jgi:hypothetical protein
VNERGRQFSREIASLQVRVDLLTSSCAASERILTALASQAETAVLMADAAGAARLARKMKLTRQRTLAVTHEIGTLRELIAARLGVNPLPGSD